MLPPLRDHPDQKVGLLVVVAVLRRANVSNVAKPVIGAKVWNRYLELNNQSSNFFEDCSQSSGGGQTRSFSSSNRGSSKRGRGQGATRSKRGRGAKTKSKFEAADAY
jgi:hypothetical protein